MDLEQAYDKIYRYAYDNRFVLGDIRYGSIGASEKQYCGSRRVERIDLPGDDCRQHL